MFECDFNAEEIFNPLEPGGRGEHYAWASFTVSILYDLCLLDRDTCMTDADRQLECAEEE